MYQIALWQQARISPLKCLSHLHSVIVYELMLINTKNRTIFTTPKDYAELLIHM